LPGVGAYDGPITREETPLAVGRSPGGKKDAFMLTRRCPVLAVIALTVLALPAFAQRNTDKGKPPPQAPTPQRPPQEQQDIDILLKAVDAVSSGAPAPADVAVTWDSNHFIKGQGGETYVPFDLTIDRTKLASAGAAVYLRVVDKKAPSASTLVRLPTAQTPAAPATPNSAASKIYFVDLPSDGRLSRAIMLKGGEYELFVAVKEKSAAPPPPPPNQRNQRNAPPAAPAPPPAPAAIGLLRRDLVVPDFNTADLNTSSILLVESVEPLTTQISPEEQEANPYAFGPMRLNPARAGQFKKSGEFQVVFWVYNAKEAGGGKPDLVVDYSFYTRLADSEKYFNKTAPQPINAQNLPPDFTLATGLPLPGQLVVPLTSFPAGDYRLEIRITDKAATGAMITRSVDFTVLPI
jgi:hypothetical protein